ncbi:MAG TPA: hypothetical protein VEI49_12805 [Terriglobales bacterium]|nr:hypothetical protein [Terriglobales bacterium]
MHTVGVSLVTQLALAFGMAGLLWPEKLAPIFDVLLFPWPASYRAVRLNSIAAILLSITLFLVMLARLKLRL